MQDTTKKPQGQVPSADRKKIVYCNICQQDYVTVQLLAKHFISGVHGSKKCNICEKPFPSVQEQIQHFVSESHADPDIQVVSEWPRKTVDETHENVIGSKKRKTSLPSKHKEIQKNVSVIKGSEPQEKRSEAKNSEKQNTDKAVFKPNTLLPNTNSDSQEKSKSAKIILPNKSSLSQEKSSSGKPTLQNNDSNTRDKSIIDNKVLSDKNNKTKEKAKNNDKEERSSKQCDIDNKWCNICQIKFLSEEAFNKHTNCDQVKFPSKRTASPHKNNDTKKIKSDIESDNMDGKRKTESKPEKDIKDNGIEFMITKVEKSFENYENLLQMVRLEWIDQISVPTTTTRLKNFVKYVMEDLKIVDKSITEQIIGGDKGEIIDENITNNRSNKEYSGKRKPEPTFTDTTDQKDKPEIKIEIPTPEKKTESQEKGLPGKEIFHTEPEVLCEDTVQQQKEILVKMMKVFEEQKKKVLLEQRDVEKENEDASNCKRISVKQNDSNEIIQNKPENKIPDSDSSSTKNDTTMKEDKTNNLGEKNDYPKYKRTPLNNISPTETENSISSNPMKQKYKSKVSESSSTENEITPQKGKTNFGELKNYLKTILIKLQKEDSEKIFHKPVDLEDVPDYLDIIETPMDFSTMKKKLNNFEYKCLKDLEDDFHIMVKNCLEYNEEDTIYYKDALKMKEKGACILNEMRTEALEKYYKYVKDPEKDLVLEKKNESLLQVKECIGNNKKQDKKHDNQDGEKNVSQKKLFEEETGNSKSVQNKKTKGKIEVDGIINAKKQDSPLDRKVNNTKKSEAIPEVKGILKEGKNKQIKDNINLENSKASKKQDSPLKNLSRKRNRSGTVDCEEEGNIVKKKRNNETDEVSTKSKNKIEKSNESSMSNKSSKVKKKKVSFIEKNSSKFKRKNRNSDVINKMFERTKSIIKNNDKTAKLQKKKKEKKCDQKDIISSTLEKVLTSTIEEKALQMIKDALMKITPTIENIVSSKDEGSEQKKISKKKKKFTKENTMLKSKEERSKITPTIENSASSKNRGYKQKKKSKKNKKLTKKENTIVKSKKYKSKKKVSFAEDTLIKSKKNKGKKNVHLAEDPIMESKKEKSKKKVHFAEEIESIMDLKSTSKEADGTGSKINKASSIPKDMFKIQKEEIKKSTDKETFIKSNDQQNLRKTGHTYGRKDNLLSKGFKGVNFL